VAGAANDDGMIPEQVWDARAPSGRAGFTPGEATFSATPLAWSHAVLVRLAWSIEAGHPVERPAVVACRYTGNCVPRCGARARAIRSNGGPRPEPGTLDRECLPG